MVMVNVGKGIWWFGPPLGRGPGGCADITALPLLEGVPNVTFLGLGCRLKAAMDPCHLMLGAPGETLRAVHAHLLPWPSPSPC
jgi:uncharacterized protein (DUF169 family)